jgi:hypothetical protein
MYRNQWKYLQLHVLAAGLAEALQEAIEDTFEHLQETLPYEPIWTETLTRKWETSVACAIQESQPDSSEAERNDIEDKVWAQLEHGDAPITVHYTSGVQGKLLPQYINLGSLDLLSAPGFSQTSLEEAINKALRKYQDTMGSEITLYLPRSALQGAIDDVIHEELVYHK